MAKAVTDLIIINGVRVPAPDVGYSIDSAILVDSARNANGTVVGQVIGRPIWKINNLKWSKLTQSEWKTLKNALKPFYVKVTFTGDDDERHTITMYPGDKSAIPMHVSGYSYTKFSECKFNLIDCGIKGED